MLLKSLQCTGQSTSQQIIQLEMPVVIRLRNPVIMCCSHCKEKKQKLRKVKELVGHPSDCNRRSMSSNLGLSKSEVQSLSAEQSSFQELLKTRREHGNVKGGILTAKLPKPNDVMRNFF